MSIVGTVTSAVSSATSKAGYVVGSAKAAASSVTSVANSASSLVRTITGSTSSTSASGNSRSIARINQEGERLYTVRPRYYATDPENPKRGEAASIRIITSKGALESSEIASMLKGSARHEKAAVTKMLSTGYQEFILSEINYSIAEKHQVFQTFGGKDAVYFYGRAPIMLNISGFVIDDLDNDQFAKMASAYTNHLRGTRLAKNYSIVELSLPNATFFGAITAINFSQSSDRDTDVRFSMSFIVRDSIFRSTDTYFTDDSGNVVDYQNENFLQSAELPITKAVVNAKSADAKAVIRGKTASTVADNVSGLDINGIYQNGVDIIPSMSDLLGGFSLDDLTGFFTKWNNALGEVLSVVTGVVNDVNSFVNEARSYIGAIEAGIDGFLSTISNVVIQVENMVDNLKDAYGTIVNFPETLSNKIGRFISNGFIEPSGASIVGSRFVSAADAEAALRVLSRNDAGPIRGTDLVEAVVNKNADSVAIIDAEDV